MQLKASCLCALVWPFLSLTVHAADSFTPTTGFIDNGDGTVTHKLTNLTWKRCAEGQTWADNICSGTANVYTFDQAKALISSFAGMTDWRLPSPWEIVTITDYDTSGPAINSAIFPNTSGSDYWSSPDRSDSAYWTGVRGSDSDLSAWIMRFDVGYLMRGNNPSATYAVRLMRGGETYSTMTTPTADFTDNGNGTVTHNKTGLTWKRCAEGQTWTGSTCTGTATSYTYSQAMALTASFAGNADWRLPDIQELSSIAEYGTTPAINTAIFPNPPPYTKFWSRTPEANSSNVWYQSFTSGDNDTGNIFFPWTVRLVRGSQSSAMLSVTLSDCLFNWAEQNYTAFLSPAGVVSATLGEYDYRYYTETTSYLAIKNTDNHLYYLGPATGNQIADLGSVTDWLSQAGCQ